jgi:hypothetical protein
VDEWGWIGGDDKVVVGDGGRDEYWGSMTIAVQVRPGVDWIARMSMEDGLLGRRAGMSYGTGCVHQWR